MIKEAPAGGVALLPVGHDRFVPIFRANLGEDLFFCFIAFRENNFGDIFQKKIRARDIMLFGQMREIPPPALAIIHENKNIIQFPISHTLLLSA